MRLSESFGFCWYCGWTALALLTSTTLGFTVPMIHPPSWWYPQPSTPTQPVAKISIVVLHMAANKQQQEQQQELPDIDTMKAIDMKKELERYGISTKSLLEKSDFVKALQKLRQEGRQPILVNNDEEKEGDKNEKSTQPNATSTTATTTTTTNDATTPTTTTTSSTNTTTTTTTTTTAASESSTVNGESVTTDDTNTTTTTSSSSSEPSREEIFQKALETAKLLSVNQLRKELKDRGIRTETFLEKSDFVKAYADAIAYDIPYSPKSPKGKASTKESEEPLDPSYRTVATTKFDKRQLMGQSVIDITIR